MIKASRITAGDILASVACRPGDSLAVTHRLCPPSDRLASEWRGVGRTLARLRGRGLVEFDGSGYRATPKAWAMMAERGVIT